jgi:hypothetical protein
LYLQVDSFNRALARNTTAGKLTQLFKTKMLSRTSMSSGASPASASKSPSGSSGGGATAPLSADELLQWSNVSAMGVGIVVRLKEHCMQQLHVRPSSSTM